MSDEYFLWNKGRSVATADDDLAYDGAADMGKFGLRDQKNGVDSAPDNVVELGNGFFIVKIRSVSQTTQQVARANAQAIVRRQVFKVIYPYLGISGKYLSQPFQPLIQGKQVFFCGVDTYCHYYLVEQWERPFDQVYMAGSDGVERTRKNCYFHKTKSL